MTIQEILAIAAEAYNDESDGLCSLPTLAHARAHKSGDTLADFIVLELHEVLTGTPPDTALATAIAAMDSATRQLNAIIQALTAANET